MATTFRGNGRALLALSVLLAGMLLSISTDRGDLDEAAPQPSRSVLEAPRLTMSLARGQLSIAGTTRSASHEAAIAEMVEDRFADRDVRRHFTAGIVVPDAWEPISVRLLYVMAAMESATAVMQDDRVSLTGVTVNADVYRKRLAFLRESMPAAVMLDEDVFVVDDLVALEDLCRRSFAELGALPVSFAESSAELHASSYPSLDKLVDFAWDCRNVTILITGHTDASGSEAWNRMLSRKRAQAVADYLAGNGVEPARLVVAGRGSAEPVADNATRYGRSLNRRIEFELRSPLL